MQDLVADVPVLSCRSAQRHPLAGCDTVSHLLKKKICNTTTCDFMYMCFEHVNFTFKYSN